MCLNVVAQRAQLRAQSVRTLREVQAIGTAISRLAPTLHPAVFLHAVHEPSKRDRRDLEMLGECRLARAFATKQRRDQGPLGPRQTQPTSALLDALRHETGQILDQASQRATAFWISHLRKIVGRLTVSKLMNLISELTSRRFDPARRSLPSAAGS